ncbi:MAG TPA: sigma-70 family RNA polymerase sigma factor [Candidatus Saccharimonadales bacterium]|nr:sigma-70 family RNA polymerase sigma factor [Candidatus Saccharimonadales bacterium]
MTTTESAMPTRFLPWAAATEADWGALYAEHLPRVYNFFRYRVGAGPDAEDLTGETFERAWRARHRYRRDLAGFGTWLFTIAQRLAIDHYRRRREHAPLEAAAGVAGGPTPEDLAVARSDAERLSGLLERLPARERELVALKFGAELTNRAIARLTGLSESNVGTILHRVLQGLRAEWFAEEGGSA